MKIGIIGLGYVGSAIQEVMKNHYDLLTYDINKDCNCNSIADMINGPEEKVIFICVPTPMNIDGSCNIDTVVKIIREINNTIIN